MSLLRRARRAPRRAIAVVAAIALAALAITVVALSGSAGTIHTRAQFISGTPESGQPVRIDTTLYLPAKTPAPAVLLAHGFGGSKTDLDHEARTLAHDGYVVLAYSARGFGASGGLIHLDSPAYEVRDASLLVTYLAALPQVERIAGKPRVAVAGASYGGALALLLAGADPRVEAVGADITWNNLATALFPNAAGSAPGAFKKLWAGYLFGSARSSRSDNTQCGRFAPDLCAAYQQAAQTGRPDSRMLALLRASSPATSLARITAPTLLSQGEQDSLFPLTEADANARGISVHGTPVRVVWRAGGHDGGDGSGAATAALTSWLADVFGGRVHGPQQFSIAEQRAALSATSGLAVGQTLQVDSYPGLAGAPRPESTVVVQGQPQIVSAPAGGNPSAVTTLPGIGGALGQAAQFAQLGDLSTIPGQAAAFVSEPLSGRLLVAGAPTVTLTVTTRTTTDATLFVALHDVAPDGTDVLPSGLVAPLRLTGLRPGQPHTVTVGLPAVVRNVPAGHRLRLSVATTDLAYQLPTDPREYTVALAGSAAPVTIPTASGRVLHPGNPVAWLLAGLGTILLAGVGVPLVIARRRRTLRVLPELAEVPISISGLVKKYADGYRAVDDVTFRVERGQVVGLLGPNGAGKTTTLRVLVGLITPTSGEIHVFGDPVRPGAPVLARIGAFIEGPGFLPHLSGRENLQLFWSATGRPDVDAEFETALEIAGLDASVDRRVKTYSHGMKQRLGIAQAMLGLPELLVLDEPTNGLDPPQIAEMREVLQRYAATGRTVVVSSHLLAEVEQTCTHVVVMHRGRLVAAGSVTEIAGSGGSVQLVVDDPEHAAQVLVAAGISARPVPARRALEDVFLDLIGGDGQ
ncbi:MAG: transporter related protein [Pseudonocardiales bacterium]|nr:transporter related protein [Pseudonocardiales bacterium]